MNVLTGRKITIADLGGGHAKVTTLPPPEPPPPESTRQARRDIKWQAINQLLTDLVELYEVFDALQPKPLAIGIHTAILADLGRDPTVLSRALSYWCSQQRYLTALCANDQRYGLDGLPNGEVTTEQRLHAREVLRRMRLRKRG